METKKILQLLGLLLWFPIASFSQMQILSIDDCQQKARDNYPLINQYKLLEYSKDYNLSNLSKGYLPQIVLNAQATYQSEVVNFPISIPGISVPALDKDQYKAVLDVNQIVWDGGNISAQKKVTQASSDVDKQKTDADLYAIRDRVNQLFFGILTIDEQLKQLELLDTDLQNNLKMVQALFDNGTGSQSDVDAVEVEILNTDQRRTDYKALKKAYSEMLSVMINEKITNDTKLEIPVESDVNPYAAINRPEVLLFEKQKDLFDAQNNLINAKNLPKLSVFLQGGYGKPGLNMLSNNFDFFGLGGVRITWNFGNLYTRDNERRLISVNKDLIKNQEETFVFNTNLQLTQVYNDVLKAKKLMEKDDEIIMLRSRIKKASESKYENGVYTINDLIRDVNAENQSRQLKIIHEVQYLMNIYNYKNISGN